LRQKFFCRRAFIDQSWEQKFRVDLVSLQSPTKVKAGFRIFVRKESKKIGAGSQTPRDLLAWELPNFDQHLSNTLKCRSIN
jgi:hypothetical protein